MGKVPCFLCDWYSFIRKLIIRSLEMSTNCHYIVKIPEQFNITYAVSKKSAEGAKSFTTPLVQELMAGSRNTPKTIVYCHSYPEIVDVFQDLVSTWRFSDSQG